jgi:chaperonin GroES
MEGQFKPLGDRVLVKPNEQTENRTKGGIIIADSITMDKKVYGEVVSVGTGIFSQNGQRIPMTVKVGDKVMYAKDMGGDEITMGDEKYLLFNEHQLLGIVQK